jgi:hypothetical protein
MAFLDNIYDKPPPSPQLGDVNFIIYTMDVLQDPAYIQGLDEAAFDDEVVAAAFQGISNFGIRKQSNIPYEQLEMGQLSSDSIGGTPYEIAIVAEVAPTFNKSLSSQYNLTNDVDRRSYIGDVEDMLNDALENKKQMVLLFKTPLFKSYTNIKLSEFIYDITKDNLNMTAFLKFQQIRVTKSEYGYVALDDVNDPRNASQRTNGAGQPQQASATVEKAVS